MTSDFSASRSCPHFEPTLTSSAMFQHQGAAFIEEELDFIEPVMGSFHIQMNMLKLMVMTYCGRPDAPSISTTLFVTERGRVNSDDAERHLL